MRASVAGVVGLPVGQGPSPGMAHEAGGRLEPLMIEALAEDAHLRADLGVPFPDPLLLARRNDFTLWPTTTPPACGGPCSGQAVFYRPGLRRTAGCEVYHGLAHGLLLRHGKPHEHPDVTALALALMATRSATRALLRESIPATARTLVRRNIHAPTLLLRLRVEQVWLSIPPSPLIRFC